MHKQQRQRLVRDVPRCECICVEVEVEAIQNKPVSNSSQSFQAAYGATVQDFRGQNAGRTGLNKEGGGKSN